MKVNAKETVVRSVIVLVLAGIAAGIIMIALFAGEVRSSYADRIVEPSEAEEVVYGVVLGASVDKKTSVPNVVLQDRLDVAVDLLKQKKIMGIIVTGDDGKWRSNEVKGMVEYLHSVGVPDDVIHADGNAYRTFDSCSNLKEKGFNNVLLITQRFHLPRALYLCNKIGLNSGGVIADKRWYPQAIYFWTRDFIASPFAYFDVRGLTLIKKGPAV